MMDMEEKITAGQTDLPPDSPTQDAAVSPPVTPGDANIGDSDVLVRNELNSSELGPNELDPNELDPNELEPNELVPGSTMNQGDVERLSDDIVRALKSVYDPEIPIDIYELGLIYRVDINDDRNVDIDMTLTAPGCPVAGEMPIWVRDAVAMVEGVAHVNVNMVFDPPWDMSRMSDEARVALNLF